MEGREIDFFEQLRVGQLLKSFQSRNPKVHYQQPRKSTPRTYPQIWCLACVTNPKGVDYLQDTGTDGEVELKQIVQKVLVFGQDWSGSEQGLMNMVMKGNLNQQHWCKILKSQTVLKHYDRPLDSSWTNTSFSRWTPLHKVSLAMINTVTGRNFILHHVPCICSQSQVTNHRIYTKINDTAV